MKTVFPLLLCYVLMTAQTFALSGGPVFRSANSYVGVYSGSLRAVTDLLTPAGKVKGRYIVPNAVGMYSLSIPAAATNTGVFYIFVNGAYYSGTIVATVNPNSGNLNGLLQSTANFTTSTGGTVQSLANGSVSAKLQTDSGTRSSTALRMTGKATVQVTLNDFGLDKNGTVQPEDSVQTFLFSVSGFQQTSTAVIISTGTGATTGTGTGTATGTGG